MTVNLWTKIVSHVHPRFMEWYVAIQLLMWGIILLGPSDVYTSGHAFDVLARLISEESLGVIMFVLGSIRVLALIVNGSVPRLTPIVRIVGAFIGCFVWFCISVSFAESGVFSTWIAAWPMAFIAEFANLYRGARDARRAYDRTIGQ